MDYDVKLASNGGYWQAYWADTSKPRGRAVRSLGAKADLSRRQALVKCRQLAIDLQMGRAAGGKRDAPRLSEWLKQYLDLRTDLGKASRVIADHTGRYLLQFFDNDPRIDRITRADAAAWRAALARGELRKANSYPKPDDAVKPATKLAKYRQKLPAADKTKTPKPLEETTVCKHVRAAKRIFAEATEETGLGFIALNPFRRLVGKAPKADKRWHQVTRADLDRILDACPNDGWRAVFALPRLAGLRLGEALSLEWTDIEWAGNRLTVNARVKTRTTKKRRRVLPIEPARCPSGLTALLQKWLCNAGEGAKLVCADVSRNNLHRQAEAILARAGLGYSKPFHTLRKCREGEIAREYPQHVFAEWFGHDATVAQEFYLRVEDDLFAAPGQSAPPIKVS